MTGLQPITQGGASRLHRASSLVDEDAGEQMSLATTAQQAGYLGKTGNIGSMVRVGYDAQAFLMPNGGTGKGLQLRNLLGPFIESFVGFASNAPNRSKYPLVQEGVANYRLWQQVSLPLSLTRHKIDLFLAPYNTAPLLLPPRVGLILVLHDTILMKGFRKPDLHGRFVDFYRRSQIPPSVARSRVVLTVSQHARSEILAAFPRADVRVIPCSIDAEWFRPAPLRDREGYLLMVTASAPHKNASAAIESYAAYARRAGAQARPFKIVGLSKEADPYRKKAAELGIEPMVDFLPFVTEPELRDLYRGAAAVLFPSLAEGFGIPVLEGMATGTPVIAARATSLPEVGGDAAFYFDPTNREEMAMALANVLANSRLREEMARKGLERAETFRPETVGKQVRAFWKEFAGV
jgi:glycosyltransferase involved in cell wall biosynthesis